MANDMTGINDIYNNGLNDVYGEMPSGQNLLLKTGQVTSYYSGDDGETENGLATPETRFETAVLSGGNVVKDYHTGLMWCRDRLEAGCNYGVKLNWESAIDFGANLNYAGFTDWYIPNFFELLSLLNYGTSTSIHLYPEFGTYLTSSYIWSSTTKPGDTIKAMVFVPTYTVAYCEMKTGTRLVLPCRRM